MILWQPRPLASNNYGSKVGVAETDESVAVGKSVPMIEESVNTSVAVGKSVPITEENVKTSVVGTGPDHVTGPVPWWGG